MQIEARTFAGRFRQIGGGVGRNIADALGRLGMSPRLVSAVGDDLNGKFLLTQTLNHLVRYISTTFKVKIIIILTLLLFCILKKTTSNYS